MALASAQAAELADQAEQVAGIGLFDRKAIAAGDPIEELDETEALDHRDRRPLRFIGADRRSVALPAQGCQCLRHLGVGAGQPDCVRLVDFEEARQCRRRVSRIGATCCESPGDQRRRTVTDHALYLRQRQRGVPALAQHLVQRGAQIGRAVDERAVEIEHQQKAAHRYQFFGVVL